jgi:hypothetical protein
MAGHGRYPRLRLDSLPLDVAARKVSDKLERLFKATVYVVPTSGIVIKSYWHEQPKDCARYRVVGTFTRDATLMELAEALAPFVPIPPSLQPKEVKPCADCGTDVTKRRADGRMEPYCDPCKQKRNVKSYAKTKPRRMAPVWQSDPLNLALRDMPGFRSPLLGIAELCNG